MKQHAFNLLIGGEAGQGLQTVGLLLARSLARSGYCVVVQQTYESRVRGGHNTFAIRFSADELLAPQEPIDLIVALSEETVPRHQDRLVPGGRIIADESFEAPDDISIKVPYKRLGTGRFQNVAAMGVAGALLGIDEGLMADTIVEHFGKTHPESAAKNRQVLASAFEWGLQRASSVRRLEPIGEPRRLLLMHGHEAIALGAMSAGLRFYSFYPMSPSTSIGVMLASHAETMGMVVEQAEDEIAAVNMAVGASFAGAPSMVATSGGGFALMVETVALAGVTETPLVVVVGQRVGPATGMATRTEQADLEFVLHAGHGEFPRALFAPGTVEQCFHLTRKAFELAERYQSPIFVLTDHFLADSYRTVEPFDVSGLPAVRVGADPPASSTHYKRYAVTDSGVSPRLLPGMTQHLVVADSHEHTEDGHITENLAIR
ncbi:MAG: 2-oxoacid:acceptor oxidoreductase family protein, partial [Armatimonadota bacterium]